MKKIIKNILQYIAVIVISLVIAILLRLFVVDFYSIPSDSMQPTIEPGDFIMVNNEVDSWINNIKNNDIMNLICILYEVC